MAWITPRTWVASEVVSASTMNTHLRDNLDFLQHSPVWIEARSGGAGGASLFGSDWVDYDLTGQWGPVRFCKVGNWVMSVGLATPTVVSPAVPIYTLPVGYRPVRSLVAQSTAAENAGGGDTSGNNERVPTTFIGNNGGISTGGANALPDPGDWWSVFFIFSLEDPDN